MSHLSSPPYHDEGSYVAGSDDNNDMIVSDDVDNNYYDNDDMDDEAPQHGHHPPLSSTRATRRRTIYGCLVLHKRRVLLVVVGLSALVAAVTLAVVVPASQQQQKQKQQQQHTSNIDDEGNDQGLSLGNTPSNNENAGKKPTAAPATAAAAATPHGKPPSAPTSAIPSAAPSPTAPGDIVAVTESPTLSSSTSTSGAADVDYCRGEYDDDEPCHSPDHKDRLGHDAIMDAGKALCNGQFRFGLTITGRLQWKDCLTNATRVFWDAAATFPEDLVASANQKGPLEYYLSRDATMRVVQDGGDAKFWEKRCLRNVQIHSQCLSKPNLDLDCPYLHLHENGDLVLNHIRPDGDGWQALMSQDVYWDLWWQSNGVPAQNEVDRLQNKHPDPTDCAHFSDDFECLQDRMGPTGGDGGADAAVVGINSFGSQFVLPYGKALCNGHHMFGFSKKGRALQWKDCQTNETRVAYNLSKIVTRHGDEALPFAYFAVANDASLQVGLDPKYFEGTTTAAPPPFWRRNATVDVVLSEACVADDWLMDCPFVQLSGSGNLDLNYVGDNSFGNGTEVLRRKMEKIYDKLF